MVDRPSPTAQRRQLGIELRQLREAARLKIEPVAERLDCSPSKISRIETAQVSVSLRDVRDLLGLYQASEEQRTKVLELASGAKAKSWLHAYSDVRPSAYLGFEAAASTIRTYAALVVPGLLQTSEYARSVVRAVRPNLGPETVELWTSLRKERQSRLYQEDPPTFTAILDEAVLRRSIGGRQVMHEQLGHLAEAAKWPAATLHVLPFEHGDHGSLEGGFTILGFPEESQPGLVHIEEATKELYLQGAEEFRRYGMVFDHAREAALKSDESVDLILSVAEEFARKAPMQDMVLLD